MEILIFVLVFFTGSSLGSFFSTFHYRILLFFYGSERKKNSYFQRLKIVLLTPSACEFCGIRISIPSLIPVFGYFFSKGQCRHCKKKINSIYPIYEGLMGILCLFVFIIFDSIPISILTVFLFGLTIHSMVTDWKYFSLDYEILPFLLFSGIALNYFLEKKFPGILEFSVFGGFALFYFLLWYIFPKGIGFGDVLFAPCYAFLSGHPYWMVFLNTSYITAVLFALVFRKEKNIRKQPIPMGFFFGIGFIASIVSKIIIVKSQNIY